MSDETELVKGISAYEDFFDVAHKVEYIPRFFGAICLTAAIALGFVLPVTQTLVLFSFGVGFLLTNQAARTLKWMREIGVRNSIHVMRQDVPSLEAGVKLLLSPFAFITSSVYLLEAPIIGVITVGVFLLFLLVLVKPWIHSTSNSEDVEG